MSMLRKIATFGTAAVVALTLSAAPASAKQPPKGAFDYYAQLDCGSGVMEVGSGSDLWSTFVDLETARADGAPTLQLEQLGRFAT